ncbi:MAG TPA: hypothetical protein VHT75_12505 [Acidimicrobiales bacterium]|jgi:hypothetical protein|nr:hypothetical protein [Acidimicrobiales bacterium]
MPSSSRLVNGLAAACVLLLVAGVLFVFAHPALSASPRVSIITPATPDSSTLPTTTAATTTTTLAATTTTVAVTTTTVPPPTATTTAPPSLTARSAVGIQSFVFVDTGRATPPAAGVPGAASRTLPTIVRYPTDGGDTGAEVPNAAGRHGGHLFPLIVFAHGYDSSPAVYAGLLHFWASAGYVVAAPSFPRATAGGPLDENDVANQPGDLSFVITKVQALAAAGGPLAGIVDPAHVGVAGHSDGASTTAGIGYNTCCRDGRVLADAVMEGDEHPYPGGSYFPPGAEPALLVIQADQDAFNPPPLGQAVYAGGRSPKYLLWLLNAQHLEPYTTDAVHLAVVETVTTAFFDRYLKGHADGVTQMRRGATAGVATLTAG